MHVVSKCHPSRCNIGGWKIPRVTFSIFHNFYFSVLNSVMATVNDRAQVQRILIFSQIYSVLIMKYYTKITIWIFIKLKFFSTIFNYINTRACRFHAAWWACVVVCGGILHTFTRPAKICVIISQPYKHTQHNVHSTHHF